MKNRPLRVGDLCVTVNSRTPLLNDGQLVVIVAISEGYRSFRGTPCPYVIRTVDGHCFGMIVGPDGVARFFQSTQTRASARQLRRIDPDADDVRDQSVERVGADALPATG
jgi:hypothetical protein